MNLVSYLIAPIFCFGCVTPAVVRQQGAVVKYYNPNYVSNLQAFTARVTRRSPYLTNITADILHPWSNNVTFRIKYNLIGNDFVWKTKLCDAFKVKWTKNFMQKHIGPDFFSCPLTRGWHGLFNIEIPPKDFPYPLPTADTYLILSFHLTENITSIMEVALNLHLS